jgi:hypothetical protein
VAFDLGCTAIDLHNLPDADAPVFLTSPQLGGGGACLHRRHSGD